MISLAASFSTSAALSPTSIGSLTGAFGRSTTAFAGWMPPTLWTLGHDRVTSALPGRIVLGAFAPPVESSTNPSWVEFTPTSSRLDCGALRLDPHRDPLTKDADTAISYQFTARIGVEMSQGHPRVANEAEAKAIMKVLGKAENEFAVSLTAPLYWIIKEAPGRFRVRNGSVFFLDAGQGPFGVTASHVIDGWRRDREEKNVVTLQIAGEFCPDFDGANGIIASHPEIDIATFRITPEEIASIGKTVLTGAQNQWPPGPPQQDRGVYYAGFPGGDTMWLSGNELSFGAASGSGVATSISERDVSSMIEREYLMALLDEGLPPENYDFRGMSGGPVLSVIENGLRGWALAGVIYEGPNPSEDGDETIEGLEIVRARRAHFINSDGTLDVARWEAL